MTRFEMLGRLMNYLHSLDDAGLAALLEATSQDTQDITDETMNVITYGKDDTEHLHSSPKNAADLAKAIEELQAYDFITPEHVT